MNARFASAPYPPLSPTHAGDRYVCMGSIRRHLFITLALITVGALATWWVMVDMAQRQIAALEAEQVAMQVELDSFQAMIDRLGRSRRLGQIDVLDQVIDGTTAEVFSTTVRFVELDDRGRVLGQQEVVLPGDVIHIDTQTIRFGADDVAHGHPLRGSTLVLLRRIYSECVAPRDGIAMDVPGSVPPGYADASGDTSDWEQGLWASFWRLASEPAFARAAGVRVAQGEVVYQRMKTGQTWRLDVDAAGGVTLLPTSMAAVTP